MSSDTSYQARSREFYEDRARVMFRLRTIEGLTLKATGARFGVSSSRARQIVNAYVHETTGRRADHAQMSRDAAAIRRKRCESGSIEPDRRGCSVGVLGV